MREETLLPLVLQELCDGRGPPVYVIAYVRDCVCVFVSATALQLALYTVTSHMC